MSGFFSHIPSKEKSKCNLKPASFRGSFAGAVKCFFCQVYGQNFQQEPQACLWVWPETAGALWPEGKVSVKIKSAAELCTSPGLHIPWVLKILFYDVDFSVTPPLWSWLWFLFWFFCCLAVREIRNRSSAFYFCTGIFITMYSLQYI